MTDPYTPELRRELPITGDAFQARATHPCGRSLLRVSALCVGIAIALSGCEKQQQIDAEQRQNDQRRAYVSCLYDATGPFGSASIDIVRDCRERVYGASGTSGSAQDAQRLDPKGAGPTGKAGDAQ